MKTFIRTVRLSRWFPPNDPLAVQMARLCILREDLMLEYRGIVAQQITELDEHSEQWRRIYFLRKAVSSIWEIQSAITRICSDSEFKRIVQKQPRAEQCMVEEINKKFNKAVPLLKKLRHALGGHVDANAISNSLNYMNHERFGFIEAGQIIKTTHFKFAGELIAEIMLTGTPDHERETQLEHDVTIIADLLPIIHRMEVIVLIYADARGVI
jgi:hypothetical protein